MPPDEPERWHLQKGIPVALITGLLFQLAVIVWGAAILFNKVDDHARRIAKLEATDDDVRRDASRIHIEDNRLIVGRLIRNGAGGDIKAICVDLDTGPVVDGTGAAVDLPKSIVRQFRQRI